MLPFDRKPWAKEVAIGVVCLTLIGAVLAILYLHHTRHLDPPMIVLVFLLLLAIIPPNILIIRRHIQKDHEVSAVQSPARRAYVSRPLGR